MRVNPSRQKNVLSQKANLVQPISISEAVILLESPRQSKDSRMLIGGKVDNPTKTRLFSMKINLFYNQLINNQYESLHISVAF